MTGFGISELNKNGLSIKVITKSLNDKYLSIKCKIPQNIPEYIAYKIEKHIPGLIRRGSVFVNLSIIDKRDIPHYYDKYNNDMNKYLEYIQEIRKKYDINTYITISDIIQLQKLHDSPTDDIYSSNEFQELLLDLVDKSIKNLIEERQKEGDDLEEFFIKSINKIKISLSTIELSLPEFIQDIKIKLMKFFDEIIPSNLNMQKHDKEKFLTEFSYFFEKSDITEEIVRFKSHLRKFQELISITDEPVGLSMGFVIQEMQREISTISAKYNNISVFPEILKIKEEIEKCKEQAFNVE